MRIIATWFVTFNRRICLHRSVLVCLFAGLLPLAISDARAALLAYEPFTNAPGTAVIGSGDGFGFSDVWQSNSSQGTATNTGYGLS